MLGKVPSAKSLVLDLVAQPDLAGLGEHSSKVQQTRSTSTNSKDIFVMDVEGLFSLSILETLLFVPEHSGYGASCRL